MTVGELGRRLSARELSEWQAFFSLEARAADGVAGAPQSDQEQLQALLEKRAAAGLAARARPRRR